MNKICFAVCLFLGLLVASSASLGESADVPALYQLLNSGKYTDLETQLASTTLPDGDKDLLSLRSQLALATGRYELAKTTAEKLTTVDPVQGGLLSARARYVVGDYDGARKVLMAVRKKAPKNLTACMLLADIAKTVGDRDTLKRMVDICFDRYAQIDNASAAELTAIAHCVQDEDPHGAWRAFQEAEIADPTHVEAYVRGGMLCYDKYAWRLAKESFDKALKHNPYHAGARAGLAAVHMANDAYDFALGEIEAALAVNPNEALAYELKSQIVILDEHVEESLELLQRALAINPRSPSTLSLLAAHYDNTGDAAKRDEVIAKIHAICQNNTDVYATLAAAADRRYHFAAAVEWGRKAIATNDKDWQGYYQAGMGLLRLGEETEGYEMLDKAFSKNGFNIWAYNILLVLDKDFKRKQFVYRETEHFFVKMDKKDSKVLWPYLAEALEETYAKFAKKYDFTPTGPKQFNKRILVIIQPSHQYFSARTVGLPGLGAAGVCFGQVILMPSPRIIESHPAGVFNWRLVFEHEFIHVLTVQRSAYNIPRWFTEGISCMEEEDANIEWDPLLAWGVKNDKLLPVEHMNTGFTRPRFGGQFTLSYCHSSVLCDYITKTFGFSAILKMLDAYREGRKTAEIIPAVTGKSLAEFNAGATAYVNQQLTAVRFKPLLTDEDFERLNEKASKVMGAKEDWLSQSRADIDRELSFEQLAERAAMPSLTAAEWRTLALTYLEKGQQEKARQSALKARELGDKGPDVDAVLGVVAAHVDEDLNTAEAAFRSAISQDPEHAMAILYLGRLLAHKGEAEAAIAQLEKARTLCPRLIDPNRGPLNALADLYVEQGQAKKAIAILEGITQLDRTQFDVYSKLGDLLMGAKMYEKAGAVYLKAIDIKPFNHEIHQNAAAAFKAAGAHSLLEREYRVMLALKPRDLDALVGLSELLLDTGKGAEAKKFISRIRRIDRDNEEAARLKKRLDETTQ